MQIHPPVTVPSGSTASVPSDLECSKDEEDHLPKGLRYVVWNFTPSWFTATMGTGIVAVLLQRLPYNADWIYWLSIVFFVLNVLLFTLFGVLSAIRYILYPEVWSLMIHHPTQALFLGAIPMGFTTIINMFVYVCVPAWGPWAATMVWIMWWIDAAASVATCLYLPFVLMYIHVHNLKSMTAIWLFPVVTTVVCASTGGVVAEILPNPNHALWTIIASYILWGMGVPLALTIIVIYFQRLTMHNLPPREVIVSVFIPLGPLGQGGYGIMQLGRMAMKIFPQTETLDPLAGEVLYIFGFIVALLLWGFALVWLFFALASITRSRFPFNMGWWGFTFPIGVFAQSTISLGREMPSTFFTILGTIFSLCVVLLWIVVAAGTLRGTLSGELFQAPCLSDPRQAYWGADEDGEKRV